MKFNRLKKQLKTAVLVRLEKFLEFHKTTNREMCFNVRDSTSLKLKRRSRVIGLDFMKLKPVFLNDLRILLLPINKTIILIMML